jgi:ABC-type microcin C transport system permease subunit YejE
VVASHYEVLGVKQTATTGEIGAAYRKLAKKFHPDTETGDPRKFQQIQQAYEVLKDKSEREVYDFKQGFNRSIVPRAKTKKPPVEEPLGFLPACLNVFIGRGIYALGVRIMYAGMILHTKIKLVIVLIGFAIAAFGFTFCLHRRRASENFRDAATYSLRFMWSVCTEVSLKIFYVLLVVFVISVSLAGVNWGNKTFLHMLPTKIWHN